MSNTDIFDENLNPVLEVASNEDLHTLVEYVADKISEDLTSHDAYKENQPDHSQYADLIAREVRDMGGNSLVGMFRGEGPSYHEIVRDVADKLNAPYNKDKDIETIENSILETVLVTALDKMTQEQKDELYAELKGKGGMGKGGIGAAAIIAIFKAGGFYSYQLTLIIANQVARALLGHGLALGANAGLAKLASVLAGPIGMAIAGLWTAVNIAGPAYKVTIPCVIHIAMLRIKLNSIVCGDCGATLPDASLNFCSECGNRLKTVS